jgi:hypothetical protein
VADRHAKVALLIRNLDVLEAAFSERRGVKGHKLHHYGRCRRRRVVGTLRLALVAHWAEERSSSPFACKWLKSS